MLQLNSKFKTALEFCARVTVTALLIITILCGGFVAFNTIRGYKSYSIISSSMAPLFIKGDMIFVKQVSFDKLQVNDVITFRQPDTNAIVTHRISRIDSLEKQVYTIGDRNFNEDPAPVDAENIKGVYVYKIQKLGAWFK